MKAFRNKILINTLVVIVASLGWISCKDDAAEELNLARQFTPADFEIEEGETSALVLWSPSLFTMPGEVQYQVEFSKTTDFANVEHSLTVDEAQALVHDTDIDIRTDYYARVKALGSGSTGDSHWLVGGPFQITGEVFILPLAESDITTDAVRVTWTPDEVLTRIVVTPTGGGAPIEVTITEAEANAGEKIVDGLSPGVSYVVEIFMGDVSKGFLQFDAKRTYDDFNVIDLTGITGRPGVLADTLPVVDPGSVILLKRGETYTISSYSFDKSITITSGADFNPNFATIFMTNSFNLVASSAIDSLVFKDVNITGEDFNGDYAFNINQVGSIQKVLFDHARIHNVRGVFRVQTGGAGTVVDNLIFNHCVIDSVREFSVAWTNNSNIIANIRIANSTIFKARRMIVHNSAGSNSIVIENSTFNEVPSGNAEGAENNYFIDLGSNTSANAIRIVNTIIGKGWNEGAGEYVHGIRTGGTSVSVENSYSTSDFLTTNPSTQISGLLTYPGTSVNLFVNPDQGDFTIAAANFPAAGSAGDPRWRQ